ncbi:hypothetical protein CfE428DRAFT_4921 [Chthoniobacter flavus Ellin428]|uniref:Alginate export domain-containing protein n=1 Tax=Chthoniobacter flavus Ellin428 TaxID=497964 RepID=B4D7K6_9BACT|nr:alginate export family protein [Chthoniobacter flavus]EDY17623.1 hypothetical protein CfE428DRAFT_4921 [Chthoniobacter flavus Ellin428]TCO92347.1 alginate export protein [Chthoniobacter flavus]
MTQLPTYSSAKKSGGLFAAALLTSGLISSLAGDVEVKATSDKTVIEKPTDSNPLSFFGGKLIFDAQERLRWENRNNNFDFNSATRSVTDGNWFEQRFRIGMLVQPVEWLHLYVQGQDSREFNGLRGNTPGVSAAEGDNAFDLRQAYIEISDYDKCPFGLKVGRQILSYGDERLVGAFDWNNFGRTFDAAKVTYKGHGFWIDAFTSTPVVITRDKYDQSDLFNGTEDHRELVFSGLYLSMDSLPFGTWDFYSFLLDQPRGNTTNLQGNLTTALPSGSLAAHSDFVTLGTRIKGDPQKLKGWEYTGEFAYQAGDVRGLPLSAFAADAGFGYNFDVAWKPRLYAEYNYASGDNDPHDGHIGTFQNLFPTNHRFFGIMDNFSWQNMHNAMLSVRVNPVKALTAEVQYNAFWLASDSDVWYRANGLTAVRPLSTVGGRNVSNYAGSEISAVVTWNANKHLQFQAGYAHFFAGNYLKDTGASDDANFGYIQTTINF